MNLINVATARSVWLFTLDELNRHGVRLYPTVAQAMIERYDFDELAEDEYKPDKGLHLKNGAYRSSGNLEISVSVQVYNDGIVAETTSSTADSDAFIEDLLKWVASEFGMNYHGELVRQKLYYSELVVNANVDLDGISDKLQRFAEHLSSLPFFGVPNQQHTAAIAFASDGKAQPSFAFDRRSAVPFKDNRYFTKAALPTSGHLSLLDDFERMLSTK